MTTPSPLEQALQQGRYSASAAADVDASASASVIARLLDLQPADAPMGEPLEQSIQVKGALTLRQRDANILYFCDRLFEQCQGSDDLEPVLLERFLELRPWVAAAMLADPRTLQTFNHPLHHLLNRVWAAAALWSADLGRPGDRYRKQVEDMIIHLRQADPVNAPFDQWLANFSEQLDKDTQRAELLTARITEAALNAAATQLARRVVCAQVNQLLASQPMPDVVGQLLKGPWSHAMHLAFTRYGQNSEAWSDGIKTAELLLESLVLPQSADDKQRVYQLVAKMPAILQHQLSGSCEPTELNEWIAQVEALHVQVLMGKEPECSPQEPMSLLDDEEGTQARVSASLVEEATRLDEGQWIIYHKDTGETSRCKLATKMEDSGQMLFVNVLGAKSMEKSFEEFAYLFTARHVRLLNASNSFAEMLTDTVQHFRQLFEKQAMLQAEAQERQRVEQERRRQAQEKARREAEKLAQERLAAQARARDEARKLAEEEARREAELTAQRAARKEQERQQAAEQARQQEQAAEQQARLAEWEAALQAVRTLGVGAWIEMEIAGSVQKCKLAAVINSTDKLILVARDGRKLAEPKREELARLLLGGKAAIIDRGDQFENSLAKVIQTLRKE